LVSPGVYIDTRDTNDTNTQNRSDTNAILEG
jgi:hypothetical protein